VIRLLFVRWYSLEPPGTVCAGIRDNGPCWSASPLAPTHLWPVILAGDTDELERVAGIVQSRQRRREVLERVHRGD
jgi:hypothetical protein